MVGAKQVDECFHSNVLGIVIVSFLSLICYALLLDTCPYHCVAYFRFVRGCQTVARVLSRVFFVVKFAFCILITAI